MFEYLLKILISIDQLVNAILLGDPDETLSARAHRMRVKGQRYWGWTAGFINKIFFKQEDHCRDAFESEILRRQLPEAYSALCYVRGIGSYKVEDDCAELQAAVEEGEKP